MIINSLYQVLNVVKVLVNLQQSSIMRAYIRFVIQKRTVRVISISLYAGVVLFVKTIYE